MSDDHRTRAQHAQMTYEHTRELLASWVKRREADLNDRVILSLSVRDSEAREWEAYVRVHLSQMCAERGNCTGPRPRCQDAYVLLAYVNRHYSYSLVLDTVDREAVKYVVRIDPEREAEERGERDEHFRSLGYMDALKGVQEVYVHPDEDLPAGMEESENVEGLLCRIKWYEDRGDASVGMQGFSGWVLTDDQTGTSLEQVLTRREG